MDETKFTPGPWSIKSGRSTGGAPSMDNFYSAIHKGNGIKGVHAYTVAMWNFYHDEKVTQLGGGAVSVSRVPNTERREIEPINGHHPDAHLIAAAPDLYHALDSLIYRVEKSTQLTMSCEDDCICEVCAGKAILARARGN
jgi:hypothetical protein